MNSKLMSQATKKEIGGVERIIQLIPLEPHPADEFVPKEDTFVLLLRYSITWEERRLRHPIRKLKKLLEPKLAYNRKLCHITHRLMVENGHHWYVVEYHIYAYDYGRGIYNELVYKLFK